MTDDRTLPVFGENVDWDAAQSELWAHELGDGLPMVPPTRARLEAMLLGVREPEQSYGALMPLYGDVSARAVAYQCVLAGCEPAHLPVVLTALIACMDDSFNLLGIATTTGTPAVAVVVHGAITERLGLNSGTNCLGPGNAANACIGRAVGLALRNIGGARPGVGDMATMGQPGKYGFCFAESRAGLLPSLSEQREQHGLQRDADAVTVLGVSGTAEVLPIGQDTPEEILTPMAVAMWSALIASGGARKRDPLQQVFLLPPELVTEITRRGWDLADIQHFLATIRPFAFDNTVPAWAGLADRGICPQSENIHPVVAGGPGVKMTYLPLWAGGTRPVTLPLQVL